MQITPITPNTTPDKTPGNVNKRLALTLAAIPALEALSTELAAHTAVLDAELRISGSDNNDDLIGQLDAAESIEYVVDRCIQDLITLKNELEAT